MQELARYVTAIGALVRYQSRLMSNRFRPALGAELICSFIVSSETDMETAMPVILWLLGVPLVVVIALMLTHVI